MSIQQMAVIEAKSALDEDPDAVYLDVRTEMEFSEGHPEGAINIPVAFSGSGGMQVNSDFTEVVEEVLSRDQSIFCGCESGVRSQMAAEILEQAGYFSLVNVSGGYGGKTEGETVVEPGWLDQGLPVEKDVNSDNSYAALKEKAGL